MSTDLQSYFTQQLEAMAALLEELVTIESPTEDKAAVDRLGARLTEELVALGAAVTRHARAGVGDIIEGNWNQAADGKPLLFVCHMDTVHPVGMLAKNPLRREDGRLYGPGTQDMKAAIVTALSAIRGLIALDLFPARPVAVLLTSDEETGSIHSHELIEERAAGAALVMIMEPALEDGGVKTWRKSSGDFKLRTYGKSAHAGAKHHEGINAIEEMAQQILVLQKMTDYEIGSTVSVGVIKGGTVPNVVPEYCEAQIDVRAMTQAEAERLTGQILNLTPVLPGARLEVAGRFDRPPMERNELMIATFERAKAIAATQGITLREGGSGGVSDGNYTAGIGAPTLDGLGPSGAGYHTDWEYIQIDSLVSSATLLAALLLEWPKN